MKSQSILGLVLVIIGILVLVYPVIPFTHQTQIAKVGPVEVNGEKTEHFAIPSVIGVVCLIAGVGVFALGARKS